MRKISRKGFTLVEIIISLTIIALIATVIGIGLNKVFKSTKDEEVVSFEERIISSTDLYLANNQNLINELETTKGYLLIEVKDLIKLGLLNENTIDPATGVKIEGSTIIKISLDGDGLLKIEYKPSVPKEAYLEAQTIYIPYKTSGFSCGYENVIKYIEDNNMWKTQRLRLISAQGTLINNNLRSVIKNIECEVDPNKPGVYDISFYYNIPDSNTLKRLDSTVIVKANPDDIISLTAKADPETVIINKRVKFIVKGRTRDGRVIDLTTTNYTVTAHSTSTVGTFTVTVRYRGDNSDGINPDTTATYKVILDPNDILKMRVTVHNSPCEGDSLSYTVRGLRRGDSKWISVPHSVSGVNTSYAGSRTITATYTGPENSNDSMPEPAKSSYTVYDCTPVYDDDDDDYDDDDDDDDEDKPTPTPNPTPTPTPPPTGGGCLNCADGCPCDSNMDLQ